MTYISKPVVRHDQFIEWLHDTFPDWTEDDIDDIMDYFLRECDYAEIYFVNNDEDLSTCDESEREIFANVNCIYSELRKVFCDTDYTDMILFNW